MSTGPFAFNQPPAQPASLPQELRDIPAEYWLRGQNTWAAITPSEGFNCTALRVWKGDEHGAGRWLPTLSEPPSMAALAERPLFYGTPILAPFVFGIPDGQIMWQGETHTVKNGKEHRVNHGFSRDHAWTVDAYYQTADAASLSAILRVGDSTDLPSMERLAEWPWPCALRAEYTLAHDTLMVTLHIDNTGDEPMPVGGGFHPYFDLEPRSGQADDTLTMRSTMRRLLDGEGQHIPGTGGYADSETAFSMSLADAVASLEKGRPMLDLFRRADPEWLPYEHDAEQEPPLWTMEDAARDLTVQIHVDRRLPYVLHFIPPSGEIISPVFSSNRPAAFSRHARGEESGLVVLEPGQSWHGWMRISVG